ncbi:hypothetical protein NPIL_590041 [Nephila pilipes]|uniref:Uncharacterized protein n=1 Tax=Nephila pilipes TaxID=299642 RepID=A0A8X6TQP9_NEPPI|nr:hypothetical protein NPIL_590041 [Nephila pilipes]
MFRSRRPFCFVESCVQSRCKRRPTKELLIPVEIFLKLELFLLERCRSLQRRSKYRNRPLTDFQIDEALRNVPCVASSVEVCRGGRNTEIPIDRFSNERPFVIPHVVSRKFAEEFEIQNRPLTDFQMTRLRIAPVFSSQH